MELKGSYIFDVEGDSLNPTKFHCTSINNLKSGKRVTLTDYDQMREFFLSAKVLIGHNIISWDIPQVERILGIKINATLIDTIWISYYLYPKRVKHGLESWGEDVGIPKPEVEDWENDTLEVYVHRCEQDVEINTRIWDDFWNKLFEIYGSEEEVMKFLKYLSFKAKIQEIQEKNKWKIDIEHVIRTKQELEFEKSEKIAAIQPHIPDKAEYKIRKRPKNLYKKDGSISALAVTWKALLEQEGYDVNLFEEIEEVKYIASYVQGNIGSTDQLKSWLFSLGWEPETFKTNKKKEEIPQVSLEHGQGLCPSVKRLFEIEPALEHLDGFYVLRHRIGILDGFLDKVDSEGYVQASFSGLTNTLRYQHRSPCVNLPKVGKAYADGIRASLIADEGTILCGSDLSGLEDRIKQHFIFMYDPEYVREMQRDDYDPHLSLALHNGTITQNQYDDYVNEIDTKTIKPIRDIFKNGNYACQYGAFPTRLSKTCGISLHEAQELWDAYWSKNSAITKTADGTKVKTIKDGTMWQQNPINGFWYSLRFEKDRFSTLVQGTASYIFDLWVGFIYQEHPILIGQFHDEFIARIFPEQRDWMEEVTRNSLEKVNNYLKLNVELDCDVQFGKRYSDIH